MVSKYFHAFGRPCNAHDLCQTGLHYSAGDQATAAEFTSNGPVGHDRRSHATQHDLSDPRDGSHLVDDIQGAPPFVGDTLHPAAPDVPAAPKHEVEAQSLTPR